MSRPPAGRPARNQWRSFDDLADTPAFRDLVQREFPAAAALAAGPDRRQFMRLMAASFALSGLAGCDQVPDPRDREVPYVNAPERTQPSVAEHYASVILLDGFANGILATTRDGRPFKIEGNPEHPWTRGGTDVFMQASILDFYSPTRSQTVRRLDQAESWDSFDQNMTGRLAQLRSGAGEQVRLLTGPVTSPSLQAAIAAMLRAYPGMRWHTHAPVSREAIYEGTNRAFGRRLEPRWRLDAAQVIVALDGDFLDPGPQQVGIARQWTAARRASIKNGGLLEMHAVGSLPSLTRAKADHQVPATPTEIAALAAGLLADLSGGAAPPPAPPGATPLEAWRARAAAALHAARGTGLVVAGSTQPPEIQEAVHRLNDALGNTGHTVFYTQPALAQAENLATLVDDMNAGNVQVLFMIDTNPAYSAPGRLAFADALAKVPLAIHAGTQVDETAIRCQWHLPLQHPLEAWGDARSIDGTVGLMQPAIEPLYEGRSPHELIAYLTDGKQHAGQDLLRTFWQGSTDAAAFAPSWEAALGAGFIDGSAFPPEPVTLNPPATPAAPAAPPDTLHLFIRPDPTIWDGAVSDNAWLQELPKPLTKLVWENTVSLAPALATRTGVGNGDIVTIALAGRQLEGPVWVNPGQADNTVGLTLGYGRTIPERISTGIGFDAYPLQDPASPWSSPGVTLAKTGRHTDLATTQEYGTLGGHDFVRVQHLGASPVGDGTASAQPSFYPKKADDGRAWGMVIDLDACIGCNACVTACQSENNIAVVGRKEVALGRWLHWIRVDRYYDGPADSPDMHFMPVPCMHCEQAPCEVGCPVEAAVHDHEGLNLMVYNRCVGTRACSSYCPYKVRRFNFYDYAAEAPPTVALGRNPSVTIRARGVMEKCTYCVQRIWDARISADKGNGTIPPNSVQTACQGACPTQAITFGDLNQKESAVAAAARDPRNYALLGELNLRPRTTYLAEMAPPPTPGAPPTPGTGKA